MPQKRKEPACEEEAWHAGGEEESKTSVRVEKGSGDTREMREYMDA